MGRTKPGAARHATSQNTPARASVDASVSLSKNRARKTRVNARSRRASARMAVLLQHRPHGIGDGARGNAVAIDQFIGLAAARDLTDRETLDTHTVVRHRLAHG